MNNSERLTTLSNLLASARTLGKATGTGTKLIAKGVKDSGIPELAKQQGRIAADVMANLNVSAAEKVLTGSLSLAQKIAEKSAEFEARALALRENTDTVRIPQTSQRIDTINALIAEINK